MSGIAVLYPQEIVAVDVDVDMAPTLSVEVDAAVAPGLEVDMAPALNIEIVGAPGPAGADGAPGVGVPTGGADGQLLAKASATDYDTEWIDAPTGGGTGRRLLLADETWQINLATGNDSTDDPLTTPFASLRAAWKFIARKIDMGNRTLTLQLSAGSHYGFSVYGDITLPEDSSYLNVYLPTGGGAIIVKGGASAATRDSYEIIQDNTGYADWAGIELTENIGATTFTIMNLKLSGRSFFSGAGSFYMDSIHFASAWYYMVVSQGAYCNVYGTTKFGGAPLSTHWGFQLNRWGRISFSLFFASVVIDPTNIQAGTPFVKIDGGGCSSRWENLATTGTWPGKKYELTNGATGDQLTTIPASTAGTVDARSAST